MPKYTVYKICPFYIDENKKTISCEDVCRSFRSVKAKYKWMNRYCDTWEWENCQWAKQIAAAYKRFEEGDIMALEEQKMDALTKETKYLRTRLGKAEKRVERQQKKIDELRAVNQSFAKRNEELYARWRKADEQIRKQDDKIYGEISTLSDIYEQRMCYLIDRFAPGGIVTEDEITEWAKDKEFALVADYEEYQTKAWKVVFREDGEDNNVQTDVQEGQEVRKPESAD